MVDTVPVCVDGALGIYYALATKYTCKAASVCIYAAVRKCYGLLFGTLYAPVYAIMYGLSFKAAIAWIIAGLPFDTSTRHIIF